MFGRNVSKGKTLFVEPNFTLTPFQNRWKFLKSVKINSEEKLDSVITVNDIGNVAINQERYSSSNLFNNYGLPLCAKKMLQNGVTFDQRLACFRLALNLKKIGLPLDICIETLLNWRNKNNPQKGRRIITPDEVIEQTKWAYSKNYKGYG